MPANDICAQCGMVRQMHGAENYATLGCYTFAAREQFMKKEVGETAYEATPAAMPWCLLPREMKSLWRKIECEVLELAAKAIEPKRPRPCDCERCNCGNPGDTAAVSAWDDATKSAELIRYMKTWGPEE